MTDEPQRERCEICQYMVESGPYRECRRRAPVTQDVAYIGVKTMWPRVMAYDWCGEFKVDEQLAELKKP